MTCVLVGGQPLGGGDLLVGLGVAGVAVGKFEARDVVGDEGASGVCQPHRGVIELA